MPTATTAVEYGDDALFQLPSRISAMGARRVLVVTGRRSFTSSGASEVMASIEKVTEVTRWYDFAPNPDVDDLIGGLAIAKATETDVVIGIGGGSVMDMAKLICAFDGCDDADQVHASIRSGTAIATRNRGLMLVPTTSGSGSEATHFAVVYIGSEKFSIAGDVLHADVVALDPALACTGSDHQRATSGMDAICQAIESRWAVGGTPRSNRYAEVALTLLLAAIEPFVTKPDPQTARAMQLGSHLAGRAIDVSKTTAAHALSYGITKRYGVDHGNAVAITLGHFIEDHASATPAQLQLGIDPDAHARAMEAILSRLGAPDGPAARSRFTELVDRLHLPSTLAAVGLSDTNDLTELATSVNAQRLGNNPIVYDTQGLRQVLVRA